ncbi:hypothetical protein PIB30_067554 [Stylosanthes scabra]|uniref:Uncharacterized protein n=1 Tax=Stylosanthes scabra TaxID=79078 RepID=A0ABU6ULE4_9FABA|nr:hypothetical protein [Stylosanthes scabra]
MVLVCPPDPHLRPSAFDTTLRSPTMPRRSLCRGARQIATVLVCPPVLPLQRLAFNLWVEPAVSPPHRTHRHSYACCPPLLPPRLPHRFSDRPSAPSFSSSSGSGAPGIGSRYGVSSFLTLGFRQRPLMAGVGLRVEHSTLPSAHASPCGVPRIC